MRLASFPHTELGKFVRDAESEYVRDDESEEFPDVTLHVNPHGYELRCAGVTLRIEPDRP